MMSRHDDIKFCLKGKNMLNTCTYTENNTFNGLNSRVQKRKATFNIQKKRNLEHCLLYFLRLKSAHLFSIIIQTDIVHFFLQTNIKSVQKIINETVNGFFSDFFIISRELIKERNHCFNTCRYVRVSNMRVEKKFKKNRWNKQSEMFWVHHDLWLEKNTDETHIKTYSHNERNKN